MKEYRTPRFRRCICLVAVAALGTHGGLESAGAEKAAGQSAELPLLSDLLRPGRVCTLTNIIAVGSGPSLLLEAVTRIGQGTEAVWRGAHYPIDVAEAAAAHGGRIGYDVLDADTDDLTLRSSTAQWEVLNAFRVVEDEVVRLVDSDGDGEAEAAERFRLTGARPLPEGPGTPILVQAVPWSRHFRARAVYVDRWRGAGRARLHEALVEVTGEAMFEVAGEVLPVWQVRTEAPGAYTIHMLVTKGSPHRVVRTAYHSAPDAEPLISELVAYTNGQGCPSS